LVPHIPGIVDENKEEKKDDKSEVLTFRTATQKAVEEMGYELI
jgi:hypothetical protein